MSPKLEAGLTPFVCAPVALVLVSVVLGMIGRFLISFVRMNVSSVLFCFDLRCGAWLWRERGAIFSVAFCGILLQRAHNRSQSILHAVVVGVGNSKNNE
jgi:hypothetical protein